MAITCARCGFENPVGFRFCGWCGTPLLADRPPVGSEPGPAASAERRQITALFCDLVGSTQLSEQLDPEDLRDVVQKYQNTCAAVIDRYDGHIAQYLGDGVLVYFGYPAAHEDDAQRGIRAALAIIERIRGLAKELRPRIGRDLQVRIGIDSGVVVVGQIGAGGRREELALGETINIAARLQSLAEPDTLLITESTRRLVTGYFEGERLGEVSLKGISVPVTVFRVDRATDARDRIDFAYTNLTPLIGREQEMTIIDRMWDKVCRGGGSGVLISGDAGIGKSRLVAWFLQKIASASDPAIALRCSPYFQSTPFYPIVEWLKRVIGFQRDDTPDERISRLRRLESLLGRFHIPQAETIPLLAALLALADDESQQQMSPQRQRRMTVDTLAKIVQALARERPLFVVVEDLHWADPSTIEVLNGVIERIETTQVAMLMTCRPTFTPTWEHSAQLRTIQLGRLSRPQVERIVDAIAGGCRLPDDVLEKIVERTDGIPLFVEELTKMILESGLLRPSGDRFEMSGPLPTLAIPATLHDSLMARLDRLASVRDIAQLGATIGREFTFELLSSVASIDEGALQSALAQIVDSGILYVEGEPPTATYTFKHALIQEAAYESLLKSRRALHHGVIARTIEERFPELATAHPELLAHHYTAAGVVPKAIDYWEEAGKQAVQASANREAIDRLRRGLDLVGDLPRSPDRDQRELSLTIYMGLALMAARGYGTPETAEAYRRAYELCRAIGSTTHRSPALTGLAISSFLRGELSETYNIGLRMGEMALEGEEELELTSHVLLGVSSIYIRHLSVAQKHLELARDLYRVGSASRYLSAYGQDPRVIATSYLGLVLSIQNRIEEGSTMAEEGVAWAREMKHPLSLVLALSLQAASLSIGGRFTEAARITHELLLVAREQEFPFWISWGQAQSGLFKVNGGNIQDGVTEMEAGFALLEQTGARLGEPQFRSMLADAYRIAGRVDDGLAVVADGIERFKDDPSNWYLSELFGARARLLMAKGGDASLKEAEQLLRDAIDRCRNIGAIVPLMRHEQALGELLARC